MKNQGQTTFSLTDFLSGSDRAGKRGLSLIRVR